MAEKLTARGAKVDGGILDAGITNLRALAEAVAPIATADFVVDSTAEAVEMPSGYPQSSGSQSIQQCIKLFKDNEEVTKALLCELHELEGLQKISSQQQVERQTEEQDEPRMRSEMHGVKSGTAKVHETEVAFAGQAIAACDLVTSYFGLACKVIEECQESVDLKNACKTHAQFMTRSVVLSSSLVRLFRNTSVKVFLPFLQRCSGSACGPLDEKERMQRLITKEILNELRELSGLDGGLEAQLGGRAGPATSEGRLCQRTVDGKSNGR